MWTFVLSGSLYLIGVAVVLVLRPSTMFTPDGNWKEFGIGKRQDKYTPFPFWLFCIVWALLSYGLILAIQNLVPNLHFRSPANMAVPSNSSVYNTPKVKNKPSAIEFEEGSDTTDLPKGYYMLNRKASKLAGVPKYVYLGPEMPN
jgi:hypothetical protein